MRVLVACEFSGTVRDAFTTAGHDAWSCDLLPSETPGNHYQGNVLDVLGDGWDLMIAHPPCTYLSVSGMHWTRRGLRDPKLTEDALGFVRALMDAPIERIALENPVSVISSRMPRIVDGRKRWGNQTDGGHNKLPPSADRWKIRSKTYAGIALAMAAQWSF